VGILYEAASTVGVELDTAHGLRTYRENVRKHFRTALASLEGALGLRRELLEYQKDFYASALEEARDAAVQAWVFAAPGDPVRLHQFLDLLDHHRIEAFRLAREITQDGVTFRPGEAAIVPVAQPQYRLIRGIFETVHEFEDTTFYDISTWTMPLAFNLEHAPLSGRRFNRDLVGARLDPEPPAVEAPDVAPYAYAFTWAPYFAPPGAVPRARRGAAREGGDEAVHRRHDTRPGGAAARHDRRALRPAAQLEGAHPRAHAQDRCRGRGLRARRHLGSERGRRGERGPGRTVVPAARETEGA